MAEELRYHTIISVATTDTADAGTALTNTAEKDMHIRRVEIMAHATFGAATGLVVYQVSKDNALNNIDADTTQRAVELKLANNSAAALLQAKELIRLFPKGAMTLETGERLHLNIDVNTGTVSAGRVSVVIAYHY